MSSIWISYKYREGGILPDGEKLPNIPVVNLSFIRKDLRSALIATAFMDTGFDGSVYANDDMLNFLVDLKPEVKESLKGVEKEVECEVYEIETNLITEDLRFIKRLGKVKVHVPIDPENLSDDIIIGREILNSLTLKLNGKYTELLE